MQTKARSEEKRTAVEHLQFGSKTAKRVGWEDWEFTVFGPNQLQVTNASYGYLKDDHSYVVEVEDRNGVAVPTKCECPADQYNDDYACKHRVAAATVGGETVLEAAVTFDSPAPASSDSSPGSRRSELKADGGTVTPKQEPEDTCPNGYRGCDGPESDSLPCFACYMDAEGVE